MTNDTVLKNKIKEFEQGKDYFFFFDNNKEVKKEIYTIHSKEAKRTLRMIAFPNNEEKDFGISRKVEARSGSDYFSYKENENDLPDEFILITNHKTSSAKVMDVERSSNTEVSVFPNFEEVERSASKVEQHLKEIEQAEKFGYLTSASLSREEIERRREEVKHRRVEVEQRRKEGLPTGDYGFSSFKKTTGNEVYEKRTYFKPDNDVVREIEQQIKGVETSSNQSLFGSKFGLRKIVGAENSESKFMEIDDSPIQKIDSLRENLRQHEQCIQQSINLSSEKKEAIQAEIIELKAEIKQLETKGDFFSFRSGEK